jgi:hypothetical protein
MNNFLEARRHQISAFCICADGFLTFFRDLIFKENTFKVLFASMKLSNCGDFTVSRIRISNSDGNSKNWKPQFSLWKSRQPVILKSNTETRFKIFLNFSPSSPAYGTIYRITGGFLNAATSILKRVSVGIFKIRQQAKS